MKKFGIFLLGIIVAVIGFYFLSNKTEPLPDNPPSNIEQPGDENQQPGDENETPTPDNPGDVGSETQYTTNTFIFGDYSYVSGLSKYNTTDSTYVAVDFMNGIENVQFEVGSIYNVSVSVYNSAIITEVIYDSTSLWIGSTDGTLTLDFTAVENGVFQVVTQPVQTETTGYAANNLVECYAADYTFIFTDINGNQVDTLYAGQDYTFEVTIHETDRIVTFLESNFTSPSYPNSQTAGFTFNMYDVDANSPSIWVYTALTTEAVTLTMGEFVGASVSFNGVDGSGVETFYANVRYQMSLSADSDYNITGYYIGGESIYFESPIYASTGSAIDFTIPSTAVGSVELIIYTESVGAE